jgi:hypothetical protein
MMKHDVTVGQVDRRLHDRRPTFGEGSGLGHGAVVDRQVHTAVEEAVAEGEARPAGADPADSPCSLMCWALSSAVGVARKPTLVIRLKQKTKYIGNRLTSLDRSSYSPPPGPAPSVRFPRTARAI